MLSTASEKRFHIVRWVLFLAWVLLIASLFYDPLSTALTHPENDLSPLSDGVLAIAKDPSRCVDAQGYCVPLLPAYPIALRVFWGMVVPSAIFIVLVFGHEFWRRICPLYFFSQLPRALGLQPLLKIEQNLWLQNNHFYLQFVLFFLGITARILIINSVRPVAGVFFIFTLLAAASVVALYGGRSWCHYVCPFGMVQTVFTGPKGLLVKPAHTAKPFSLTQSTCRTVDASGAEQSACVSCKSACMDIDAEQSYWEQMYKPGRRLVQYGYLGLVIGYFCYYGLYAGSFSYYFSGVWSHEIRAIAALAYPGFYLFEQEIPIPKFIAAPLTLAVFAMASCAICTGLERLYRGYLKHRASAREIDESLIPEKSLHRIFSICTFLAFNCFFVYGGRPEIMKWPLAAQFAFQTSIAVVSSLWLYRVWGRSSALYEQERWIDKKQRQLKKLPLDVEALLGDRKVNELSAPEIDVLAQTLPSLMKREEVKQKIVEQKEVKQKEVKQKKEQNKPVALPKTVIRRRPYSGPYSDPVMRAKLSKTQIRKP